MKLKSVQSVWQTSGWLTVRVTWRGARAAFGGGSSGATVGVQL